MGNKRSERHVYCRNLVRTMEPKSLPRPEELEACHNQQLGERATTGGGIAKNLPPPAAGRWGAEYTVSLGKAHARPQNGCGPQQRAATLGGSK